MRNDVMRKQKPRNALVSSDTSFTDLGIINMTPVQTIETTDIDTDVELEPEDVRIEILEPRNWTTRNKVIVRNSQAL